MINNNEKVTEFYNEVKSTGKKLIKAQITLSIITLAILTLAFYFLDLEYAFFIALGITIVDILPVIGSGIIMLPWAGYLIISNSDASLGLKIAGIYIGLLLIRQVIEPLIRGKSLGLKPLTTLLACIIGFGAIGPMGFIVGPIVAILGQTGYKIFVKNNNLPEKRE